MPDDEQSSREKEFLEFQRSVGQQNFGDPRASQEMNHQLKETVSRVKEVAEAFGQLSARITGMKDSVEGASDTVSHKVERTAVQMRESIHKTNEQITKAFSAFTAGGAEAMKALGPVGSAFDFVVKGLNSVPGGAAVLTIALATIYGEIIKLEEGARRLRVGLTFGQYGIDAQRTADAVKPAIESLSSYWNMGRAGAEKFMMSLASIQGPEALVTGRKIEGITDRIQILAKSFGVGDDAITGMYSRLRAGTDLATDKFKEMDSATVTIMHSMNLSKLGVKGFTDALFAGMEQLRMFGAESGTISKGAEGLMSFVTQFSDKMIGGAAGAIGAFKGVLGIAGSVATDPALSLFVYGEGVGGRHPFQQLVSAEARMRERGGIGIFVDYISKLQSQGMGKDEIGMLLTPKLGATASDILIRKLDQLKGYGSISEMAAAKVLTKDEAKALADAATNPMDRLKILTEEFMKTFMPAFSGTVIGLLSLISNALPVMIAQLMVLGDRILPGGDKQSIAIADKMASDWGSTASETGAHIKALGKSADMFAVNVAKSLGVTPGEGGSIERVIGAAGYRGVGEIMTRHGVGAESTNPVKFFFPWMSDVVTGGKSLLNLMRSPGVPSTQMSDIPVGAKESTPTSSMEAGGAPSYMVNKSFIGGNLVITITPYDAKTLAYG